MAAGRDTSTRLSYRRESAEKTLRVGTIFACIGVVALPYIYVQDAVLLGFEGTLPWRLAGFLPCALFLLLRLTAFRTSLDHVIPVHSLMLTGVVVNVCGLALVVFSARPTVGSYREGVTGAFFIAILAAFICSAGARRYLAAVIFAPMLTLFAIFLLDRTLTLEEWALFLDPVLTGLCVVAVAIHQEKTSWAEFRMRDLAVSRERQLAVTIGELEAVNAKLAQEIEQRRLVEEQLERQSDTQRETNRRLESEIAERRKALDVLRELAQRLQQSNEDLQHFAHIASHDLREPLRTIASFLELIRKRLHAGKPPDQDIEEFIGFAVDGAKRMEMLIKGLLAYSRVESAAQSFGAVALGEALDDALMNLRSAVETSRAQIAQDDLPTVWGDRSQLSQVFQNLVGNAIKYRKPDEPPRIAVRASETGGDYEISVQDNGIGFDARYADRAFAMFERLHSRRDHEGAGIGLAVCKKIIEHHGGRMWAQSEEGVGSRFIFTLPRTKRALDVPSGAGITTIAAALRAALATRGDGRGGG